MDDSSIWLLAIGVLIVYAHLAEYAIHRWIMHRPRGGWLREEYVEHAILHHSRERNDLNISENPVRVAALCSPLLFGCLWLSWPWAVVVLSVATTHATLWTVIHHAHHDLKFSWLNRVPGYQYWRDHHLLHHRRPNRNFGTVFPWTDWFFKTGSSADA